MRDFAPIVLTRAHSDQAGRRRMIAGASCVPAIAGSGDIHALQYGRHDDLTPTCLSSKQFSRLIVNRTPDLRTRRVDLLCKGPVLVWPRPYCQARTTVLTWIVRCHDP